MRTSRAVEQDRAVGRVVEPLDERERRALARPGRADERDARAARHRERDAAQHVAVGRARRRVGASGELARRPTVDVRVLEHRERLGLRLAAGRDDGFGVAEAHVAELDRRRVGWRVGIRSAGRVRSRTEVAIAASSCVSVGRSSTSWMRPSAPSAWLTEVIAPKNEPSGAISRKRNMTKVTRLGDRDRAGGDAEAAEAEHDEQRHLQRDARDRHDERRHLRDAHAHAVDVGRRCR